MIRNPKAALPVSLGWRERIGIPNWGIEGLRAKVDTGARTSAVHVTNIEELSANTLRFDVVLAEKPHRVTRSVTADFIRESRVKPSTGELQTRPVVIATILIGNLERTIELSLVERSGMLCRMLLGRSALDGFLVDPSRKYLISTPQKPRPS